MEKEFIPYELAVKLKQLGFDEPCFGRYYYKESYLMLNPRSKETELVFEFGQYLKQTEVTILAPTFSQAFRWFREKYPELDFGVGKIHNGTNNYHYHINLQWEFFEGTYEEAELACLIKLIEIVKNLK